MALAGEKRSSETREALEDATRRLVEHTERWSKKPMTQRDAEKFAREAYVQREREGEK